MKNKQAQPAGVESVLLIGLKEIGSKVLKAVWKKHKGSLADWMRDKTAERVTKFAREAKGPYGGKVKEWSPELEEAYQEFSVREDWDDLSDKEKKIFEKLSNLREQLRENS